MAIMNSIRRIFSRGRRTEMRDNGAGLGLTYASSSYSDGLAMRLSAVYRSVDVISSSVAQLPINLNIISETGEASRLYNNQLGKLLNRRPDARLNRYTFFSTVVRSMLLRGNAYAIIERDAQRNVVNLRYIDAGRVTINHDSLNQNVTYSITGEEQSIFKPHEILHFMNYTENGIEGISTLRAAYNALRISVSTDDTARGFFASGANIRGFLKVQGILTKTQKQQMRDSWSQTFGSSGDGAGGVAVLEGNTDFVPISMNAADAQLLQAREFNVVEIARFFGVNPVKLFDLTKSSYSTVEATQLSFLTDTLAPLLEKIEEELEYKLFADNIDVKFDSDVLLRNDKSSQASYLTSLVNNGIMSPNEARRVIGLPPVEGGDDVNIQVNMQKLNQESNGEEGI